MGVLLLAIEEGLGLRGRVLATTYQWRGDYERSLTCEPDETRVSHNILCDNGLTLLTSAIAWSCGEDQNANMGAPMPSAGIYAAPIYGAIGTGTGTPAGHDATLFTENSRGVVTGAGYAAAYYPSPALFSWLFLFPIPTTALTISECGVFFQATATPASGQLFNHALISPTITQSTTQIFTLNISIAIGND